MTNEIATHYKTTFVEISADQAAHMATCGADTSRHMVVNGKTVSGEWVAQRALGAKSVRLAIECGIVRVMMIVPQIGSNFNGCDVEWTTA